MRSLIVYATKYGAVEKAARLLADQLQGDVELVNLAAGPVADLTGIDRVIVGGSIYAGSIQEEVKQFCSSNQQQLLDRRFALFVCCGREDQAREQLAACLEPRLIQHAEQIGSFGYIYDFARMNLIFKLIIRKLAKVKTSQFNLREENIRTFAAQLNS
ncbi:flavodoxin domain-containing protein [Spirochaeta africana]|uniref:Flavodoxin n=1 Tax=Spirochaeta africana (strain ATCC 700263 / DSM 8902 / Z-7692) TaxID=889378 RepID=H9UG56_SPIAZ|nr:flavodoxin domain-containing protein [Spirochaeta africana]AFG36499.1 flavodoxin [Spirochaeta africana DSM 8902]